MRIALLLAVAAAFASPAQAAISIVTPGVDGSYTQLGGVTGAGVYGVEARRGNNALNGDWEVGVGTQTSNIGTFFPGQFRWDEGTYAFTLSWTASLLSIEVGGTSFAFTAPILGDTLRAYVKRDATLVLDTIDGTAFNLIVLGNPDGSPTTPNPAEYYFYSDDNWGGNGLTASGTLRIGAAGGRGSASAIEFKNGDFTPFAPVPAPAMLALLGLGIAALAVARRR